MLLIFTYLHILSHFSVPDNFSCFYRFYHFNIFMLYLSVNVFSAKVYLLGTRHFTWSSEPRERLAICFAKVVPSFLRYFKTLSIGPASGIKPATFRSAVKRSTN